MSESASTPKQVTGNLLGWRPRVALYTYERDQAICAQLNCSPDDMTEVSAELLREVGGKAGLGITVYIPLSSLGRAIAYYTERGCEVDVRAQPKKAVAWASFA